MANNREIVFSARDNGVGSVISRIKQSADELARSILQEGMNTKRSSQDTIKFFEEQIRLMEKRNRLAKEQARFSLDNKVDSAKGRATSDKERSDIDKKFAPEYAKIEKGSKEDKLQTELLREIVDTIRDTSQDEMEQDEGLSQKSNEELRKMVQSGGSTRAMRELNSRSQSRSRTSGGNKKGLGDLLSGGGLNMKALGAMGIGGAIFAAVTAAIKTGFTNEMEREESLSKISGVSGVGVGSINRNWDEGYFGRAGVGRRDRSTYGFKEDEFVDRAFTTSRARGTTESINERTLDALALQRGTAMDEGVITQMERLSRVMNGSDSATDMTQRLVRGSRGSGAFGKDGKDMSRLNEMAQMLVQFQEAEFMRSGDIGTGNEFINLSSRLRSTGETKFQRDDYTASTIGSLNQGLVGEGSPEAQAFKMDILRRANPQMGFFELQAEQEKGLQANGLLEGIMGTVKGAGGDINQQSVLLNQLTGGSMRKSDILSLLKGDIDVGDLGKDPTGQGLDVEARAEQATAELRDAMESTKGEVAKFLQEFMDFSRMTGGMGNQMGSIIMAIDEIKKLLQ